MIAAGEILGGKYVVERVLGAGGMGVVVAARHLELGHLVAIKTMKPGAAVDPEIVARFEREARAAARLQSEHAARVTDVGRFEGGAPYMIMEFLEGEDLGQRLEREGPLPVGEAVSLFMQCCIGLHEAHAIGLVHRDVKPSNVFLARRASGRVVAKVLDFGIAKAANEPRDRALTQTSAVMGSPQYMSPEQLNDVKTVDARADVWSLGATFFEALAGVVAFPAETLAQLHVRVLTGAPRSLREARPDVPLELEAIVSRCLARDPADRFASMMELYRALDDLSASVIEVPRPLFDSAPGAGAPRTSIAPPEAFAATTRGDGLDAPFDETVMPTSQTFSGARTPAAPQRRRPAAIAALVAFAAAASLAGWAALRTRAAEPARPAVAGPVAASTRASTRGATPSADAPPAAERSEAREVSPDAPASAEQVRAAGAERRDDVAEGRAPRGATRASGASGATGGPPRSVGASPAAEPKPDAPKAKKRGSILNPEFDE